MRSEREMMKLILDFANRDENIRLVVMNGSRANPHVRRDPFQDYDIVYVVRSMEPYMRNPAIPACFGEIMILQMPEDMSDPPGEGDGHYTYLTQFMDGNRIDLSFYPLEMLEQVLNDSLTIILLDKDQLAPSVPPSSEVDYLPKPPTAKRFGDVCNEFWWVNPYVAKGLWRDQLTYAKYMLDTVIRPELLTMLTWYYGIKTGFQRSAGAKGKYFKEVLEPELWQLLEQTYAGADFEDTWRSLFAMGELFRRVAAFVAAEYGYTYPEGDDQRVSDYLRRIQDLPPDAEDFF